MAVNLDYSRVLISLENYCISTLAPLFLIIIDDVELVYVIYLGLVLISY